MRLNFSQEEIWNLFKAWLAISLAFGILYSRSSNPSLLPLTFLSSAGTVGIGFLLHELAHKFFAQMYGCWAEFRADNKMLIIAVLSSFLGFIFVAPGAVYISGYVGSIRNGKISLAGPVTNLILATGFFVLKYSTIGILINPLWQVVLTMGFSINSWLALFNMIPFAGLDGSKIFVWSKKIYFTTLIIALIFVVAGWII